MTNTTYIMPDLYIIEYIDDMNFFVSLDLLIVLYGQTKKERGKWTNQSFQLFQIFFRRFSEVAELRTTCWLEIRGKINTQILSSNTRYGAYLIMKISNRAYGLDSIPSEVSIEVGNKVGNGMAYLRHED